MGPCKFVFGRSEVSHVPRWRLETVCDRFELPERSKVYAYPDRL